MDRENSNQQKLKFRVSEVTSQEEGYQVTELLNHTPFTKGWQSSRFCDYPQEITFEFPSYVKIKLLEFLSHQYKISSKIEIHILNPKLNKKFKKIGHISLDSNERSNFQARELKSVKIDYECLKLKIVLHRCYINQLNNFVQVGLIAFNVMGFPTIENPLENPPVFNKKDNDNLEDQMLYDPITFKRLKMLSKAKDRAVEVEDFAEAKKIKEAMDRLRAVSSQLIQLEERKQIAIKNDDFDAARIIKYEIERLRNAVAGLNIDVSGFDADTIMPSYNNMSNNQYKGNNKDGYSGNQMPNYDDEGNYRNKQFKTNVKQDRHIEDYPVNSEMFLPGKKYQDKSSNINQGNRLEKQPNFAQEDHDEKPIRGQTTGDGPVIHNENNYDDQINEDTGDDIPANLYRYAEPLIPYLSHDLMVLLFSIEWKKKEKGLNKLMDEIKSHPHSKLLSSHDPDKIITAILGAVAHTMTSTVSNVLLSSLETIKVLFTKFHSSSSIKGYYRGDLDNYVDNILILTLEKIGESNIRIKERAENTTLEMAASSIVGSKVVYEHLISGQIKKTLINSARHISARLNLISRMIDNFGLNKDEVSIQALMNFAFSGFKNSNKEVRDAGLNLIKNCYKFLGNEVKAYYNDLRQPQRELLDEEFDKIDSETAKDKYKDNNQFDTKKMEDRAKSGKGFKGNSKNTKQSDGFNNQGGNDDYNSDEQQINNQIQGQNNKKFSNQNAYQEVKFLI